VCFLSKCIQDVGPLFIVLFSCHYLFGSISKLLLQDTSQDILLFYASVILLASPRLVRTSGVFSAVGRRLSTFIKVRCDTSLMLSTMNDFGIRNHHFLS